MPSFLGRDLFISVLSDASQWYVGGEERLTAEGILRLGDKAWKLARAIQGGRTPFTLVLRRAADDDSCRCLPKISIIALHLDLSILTRPKYCTVFLFVRAQRIPFRPDAAQDCLFSTR